MNVGNSQPDPISKSLAGNQALSFWYFCIILFVNIICVKNIIFKIFEWGKKTIKIWTRNMDKNRFSWVLALFFDNLILILGYFKVCQSKYSEYFCFCFCEKIKDNYCENTHKIGFRNLYYFLIEKVWNKLQKKWCFHEILRLGSFQELEGVFVVMESVWKRQFYNDCWRTNGEH